MKNSEINPPSSSGKIKNIDYYADCFLDMAKAEGEVDIFEEEFRSLNNAINNNLDLKKFLTDPSIEKPEKISTAFKVLEGTSTNTVRATLATLITMDAVESINEIYHKFVMLVNKLKTQILVEVVSAVSIDRKLLDEIKKSIDEKTGLDCRLKNIIDKSIIGGLLIKIGDRQIDLSIKSKIDDLKTRLHLLELGGGEFVSSNKD